MQEYNNIKIFVDNKEINYLLINENGRVLETGEEEGFDTFSSALVDLKSIKIGGYLKLCFNPYGKGKYCDLDFARKNNKVKTIDKKVAINWAELNYKTLSIE